MTDEERSQAEQLWLQSPKAPKPANMYIAGRLLCAEFVRGFAAGLESMREWNTTLNKELESRSKTCARLLSDRDAERTRSAKLLAVLKNCQGCWDPGESGLHPVEQAIAEYEAGK